MPGLQTVWDIIWQFNLPLLIMIIFIVILIYIAIKKVLARLRVKGFISRGTEESIRFMVFAILSLIIIAVAISSWFQVHVVAITFIALLVMLVGTLIYALRTYIENAISYILFVSSGIVKDGDMVRVVTNNGVYEGRIDINEGGYAVINMIDSKVYIPYSMLLKSVITKIDRNLTSFKLRIKGQSLVLDKVINEIKTIINEIKVVNRENIDIKPVEVKDDEIALKILIEVPNPRNIEECCETFAKLLLRKLPYQFSLELTK